jgi:hypothetical protein
VERGADPFEETDEVLEEARIEDAGRRKKSVGRKEGQGEKEPRAEKDLLGSIEGDDAEERKDAEDREENGRERQEKKDDGGEGKKVRPRPDDSAVACENGKGNEEDDPCGLGIDDEALPEAKDAARDGLCDEKVDVLGVVVVLEGDEKSPEEKHPPEEEEEEGEETDGKEGPDEFEDPPAAQKGRKDAAGEVAGGQEEGEKEDEEEKIPRALPAPRGKDCAREFDRAGAKEETHSIAPVRPLSPGGGKERPPPRIPFLAPIGDEAEEDLLEAFVVLLA